MTRHSPLLLIFFIPLLVIDHANNQVHAKELHPITVKNASCDSGYCSPIIHTVVAEERRLKLTINEYNQLSILYALADLSSEDVVSQQCYNDLRLLQHGINDKDTWAVKAMDASARPGAGFVWGNNMWLGSRRGCESLNVPLSITLTPRFSRIMQEDLIRAAAPNKFQYVMVYAKHNSPWQIEEKFLEENILQFGLCMPKSCNNYEIFNLTQTFFESRMNSFNNYYDFDVNVFRVKDLHMREGFFTKKSLLILGAIVGVTGFLHLVSYFLKDHLDVFLPINKTNDTSSDKNSNKIQSSYSTPIQCYPQTRVDPCMEIHQPHPAEKLIKAFSIEGNFNTIFNGNLQREVFPIIGGLKTVCSLLILVFHVQWYKFFTMENPYIMFQDAEQVRYQFIANAPILVDIFFVISGFLLIHNYSKNVNQNNLIKNNSLWSNLKLLVKLIGKRYIRLTPVYLIIHLMTEIGVSYLDDTSLFHLVERTDLNCQRYWWRNLLYVQNLYPVNELCINWTWSTASEMQYFIFFTILYLVYVKSASWGKLFYILALGASLSITTYLTFKNDFQPAFDILWDSGDDLYTFPISRAAPYFAGVLAAMVLKHKPVFSKGQSHVIWCLAIVTIIACMHSTIWRAPGVWISCMVLIYARWLFAFANAWVLIAPSLGYGNWFTKFLSHKYFIYFSRTSYSFYLLNPLLITLIYGLSENSNHSDTVTGVIITCGVAFITYILSILFSISFEIPYCKLLAGGQRQPMKVTVPKVNSVVKGQPIKCD